MEEHAHLDDFLQSAVSWALEVPLAVELCAVKVSFQQDLPLWAAPSYLGYSSSTETGCL
jgi:hypothetical protein